MADKFEPTKPSTPKLVQQESVQPTNPLTNQPQENRTRKLELIKQVLKDSGADSKSQETALARISAIVWGD